ncbi:hypothetical protein [Pseudobacteriovorax antillogorgiicola]|uniref:Uncharacterized protein n=1 Tax=Pseudobacteriovorax antillogorgiicola TaxID=1513793 RepID=A0A1Y6BCH4_9BACT|nr:hypothetical protein [Pseudobacteriovorax antillogorgiicola]TCS57459.1 hypothetical protein EDD56_103199 [Pseudobacteriovorax antillogorgiicola]SMF00804.1 hypothetical protein SAMN06296036_103134 [Pseudobacteriovorax antillogorgiicola]
MIRYHESGQVSLLILFFSGISALMHVKQQWLGVNILQTQASRSQLQSDGQDLNLSALSLVKAAFHSKDFNIASPIDYHQGSFIGVGTKNVRISPSGRALMVRPVIAKDSSTLEQLFLSSSPSLSTGSAKVSVERYKEHNSRRWLDLLVESHVTVKNKSLRVANRARLEIPLVTDPICDGAIKGGHIRLVYTKHGVHHADDPYRIRVPCGDIEQECRNFRIGVCGNDPCTEFACQYRDAYDQDWQPLSQPERFSTILAL